jgi:hypothetical protein
MIHRRYIQSNFERQGSNLPAARSALLAKPLLLYSLGEPWPRGSEIRPSETKGGIQSEAETTAPGLSSAPRPHHHIDLAAQDVQEQQHLIH